MPQPPLLFMKAGVLEAEPLGFYDVLADRYDAELVNTDDINLELNNGRFNRRPQARWAVNAEAQRRARDSLASGVNVVYDGFLNKLDRRRTVRQEVVQTTGARAVLLCIYAPLRVVEPRIRQRHEDNTLTIPSALIDVEETVKVARRMMRDTEWPGDDEMPLRMDGRLSTPALLRHVADHIAQGKVLT